MRMYANVVYSVQRTLYRRCCWRNRSLLAEVLLILADSWLKAFSKLAALLSSPRKGQKDTIVPDGYVATGAC